MPLEFELGKCHRFFSFDWLNLPGFDSLLHEQHILSDSSNQSLSDFRLRLDLLN